MAWAAVAGAAASVILPQIMGGDKGGGGGGGQQQQQAQTSSREPWSAAVPWLTENIANGQQLQSGYKANPFSALQQQTYNNQLGNSDYFRSLTDSVIGQQNQQRPFDRNNPYNKPQTYQLPSRTEPAMPTSATPYSMVQSPFSAMNGGWSQPAQQSPSGTGQAPRKTESYGPGIGNVADAADQNTLKVLRDMYAQRGDL